MSDVKTSTPTTPVAMSASAASTPTTPSRRIDRFGFVVEKEEDETPEQRKLRMEKEAERIDKWRDMIKDLRTYEAKNSRTFRGRIRKGVPQQFRGLVWQLLAGVPDVLRQNRGVYDKLLIPSSPSEKQIELDIHRTFPKQVMFMEQHGAGQQALYNVLKAYSVYDTAVGYCQGMGFIAAVLLMFLPEEESFWLLVQLLNKYGLAGLFTTGMPTASMMIAMSNPMFARFVPRLTLHLEREGVEMSMFISQWFITLFTYDFPMAFVVRLWDVFLAEGVKIIFRFAIAFLKREEENLLTCRFEQIVTRIKNIPNLINGSNIEEIFDLALDLPLTERFLHDLMDEYIAGGGKVPPDGRMLLLKKPPFL